MQCILILWFPLETTVNPRMITTNGIFPGSDIKQITSQPADRIHCKEQDPTFPEHHFQCVIFKNFIN